MNIRKIASYVDHTLLTPTATWEEVKQILEEAIQYGAASACIPPSFVQQAAEFVGGALPICTVIGFPNGYSTTRSKVFETREALYYGAKEIDMVINQGWVKEKRLDEVEKEIRAIREECNRGEDIILKVIIETSALTPEEIVALCRVVTVAKADYIKTSTGFGAAGATPENVLLMISNIGPSVKLKAAGGIRTFEQAQQFIDLGASRLGSSQIIPMIAKLPKE